MHTSVPILLIVVKSPDYDRHDQRFHQNKYHFFLYLNLLLLHLTTQVDATCLFTFCAASITALFIMLTLAFQGVIHLLVFLITIVHGSFAKFLQTIFHIFYLAPLTKHF